MVQVERSVALLKRLTGERGRWEQGSETFKNQMSTIIGDVLLMSAFMAYAGEQCLQIETSHRLSWFSSLFLYCVSVLCFRVLLCSVFLWASLPEINVDGWMDGSSWL